MDPIFLLIIVVVVAAAAAWVVLRRRSDRSVTPEEQLERAALKAEQDKMKTESQYRADRYNLRE